MADKQINPEIIAAITAAVQSMTGGEGKVVARVRCGLWSIVSNAD